jgi:hypothetical protein
MVNSNELSSVALPIAVPPGAIEALERLRDSYKGLSARGAITQADQAVFLAVKITLQHIKNAQGLV